MAVEKLVQQLGTVHPSTVVIALAAEVKRQIPRVELYEYKHKHIKLFHYECVLLCLFATEVTLFSTISLRLDKKLTMWCMFNVHYTLSCCWFAFILFTNITHTHVNNIK